MTRILVWQWGRRGAGPKFAVELATALAGLPNHEVILSVSQKAEILPALKNTPYALWPVGTYTNRPEFFLRLLTLPIFFIRLLISLRKFRPDMAICAMPGLIDLVMAAALRLLRIPLAVIVHDAFNHPGDGLPLQMCLQKALLRRADVLIVLTQHVGKALEESDPSLRGLPVVVLSHPPFDYQESDASCQDLERPVRLLMFGRLLAYKGLDILGDALKRLPPNGRWECIIAGEGPETEVLHRLSDIAGVRVDNRWIPENEVGELIGWSDILLLPYREASQSGVGATALAAGRWIVATSVGGLTEQLAGQERVVFSQPDAEDFSAVLKGLIDRNVRPVPEVASKVAGEWSAMAQQMSDVLRMRLPLTETDGISRQARGLRH